MKIIKVLSKKVFTGSVLFSMILFQAGALMPQGQAFAAGAKFEGNLKLWDSAKSSWEDPISANAGDRIAMRFAYKNTGETAKGGAVTIDFKDNTNKKLVFYGYVDADNSDYLMNTGTVNVPVSGLQFTFDNTASWYTSSGKKDVDVDISKEGKRAIVAVGEVPGGGGITSEGYVVFRGTISSPAPRFNYQEGDEELLKLLNKTKGDTTWQDPVSANGGDVIAFNVYYHNGVVGSVAKNTKVSIEFPGESGNKIATVGIVDADNTSAVYDYGTINVSGMPEELTFEKTALWYPNGSSTATEVPVTISGNKVIVDIGDIKGCWEYKGRVVFKATLSKTAGPTPEPKPPVETPGEVLGAYTEQELGKVPVTGAPSAVALTFISGMLGYGAVARKKLKEKLLGSKLQSAIDIARKKKSL